MPVEAEGFHGQFLFLYKFIRTKRKGVGLGDRRPLCGEVSSERNDRLEYYHLTHEYAINFIS